MPDYQPLSTRHEEVATQIVDAAMKVHRALGPGLLESVYEQCLRHDLTSRGMEVIRRKALPVCYDGIQIDAGLRLDLVVDDLVIVEVKAVETMIPLYDAQLLTYLKLSGMHLGFLINFNVPRLKNGIKRLVRTPSSCSL